MPTYNVRIDTGEGPDEGEPMDFPDSKSACHDAQVAIAEIAQEKIPGSQKAHFVVERGRPDAAL
jgi:hypothetical protein